MKYILNENIRYILNEADGDETVASTTPETTTETTTERAPEKTDDDIAVSEIIKKLKTILGDNNTNLNSLKTVLETLQSTAELNQQKDNFISNADGDTNALKQTATKYIEEATKIVEAMRKINNGAVNKIAGEFETQKNIINGTNTQKEAIGQAFDKVAMLISQLIADTKADTETISQSLERTENLDEASKKLYKKLETNKELENITVKALDISNIETLSPDCLSAVDVSGDLEKVNNTLEKLTNDVSKINNILDNYENEEKAGVTEEGDKTTEENDKIKKQKSELRTKKFSSRDWADIVRNPEKYKDNKELNIKNGQEAWERYFETEFGKDRANDVRKLGNAFVTELLALGFSEELNPFITFVKNALKERTPSLNGSNYPAIHNSYVDHYISKADLIANTINARASTILYNKNLYSKPAQDIVRYLYYQYLIMNNIKKKQFSDKYAAYLNNKFNADNKKFLPAVILLADNSAEAETGLNRDLKSLPNGEALNKGELRPLEQIKIMIEQCWGDGSVETEKKTIDDSDVADLIAGISSSDYLDAIKYLAIKYDAMKLITNYNELKTDPTFNILNASKYENIFKNIDMSKKTVNSLIHGLAVKAKIEKEEKK